VASQLRTSLLCHIRVTVSPRGTRTLEADKLMPVGAVLAALSTLAARLMGKFPSLQPLLSRTVKSNMTGHIVAREKVTVGGSLQQTERAGRK
jgi:hypothetical protein